jgi:hypothetical protein
MDSVSSDKQRLWEKIVEESMATAKAKIQMLSHFEGSVVNLINGNQLLECRASSFFYDFTSLDVGYMAHTQGQYEQES